MSKVNFQFSHHVVTNQRKTILFEKQLFILLQGYCYQFNPDGSFYSESPGMINGFGVVLNAAVKEYYVGPHSSADGFMVRKLI